MYQTLGDLLNLHSCLVLNFNTEWCENCRLFEPIFTSVAKEFKPQVMFALIDAESCYDVLDELNITSLPTLVFSKDKKMCFTKTGRMEASELREEVKKLIEWKFH